MELGDKPGQSLAQSSPRSEGKAWLNFTQVMKQSMDLGKGNQGKQPFPCQTFLLHLRLKHWDQQADFKEQTAATPLPGFCCKS